MFFSEGGLAAPLLVGGIVGAVAGGTTSAGAGIADVVISKGKMESAQKVLQDDKKLTKKIEDKRADVNIKVAELSKRLGRPTEEVFGSLLMSSMSGIGVGIGSLIFKAASESLITLSFKGGSGVAKGLGSLAKVSVEGFAEALGTVFGGNSHGLIFTDILKVTGAPTSLPKISPSYD